MLLRHVVSQLVTLVVNIDLYVTVWSLGGYLSLCVISKVA